MSKQAQHEPKGEVKEEEEEEEEKTAGQEEKETAKPVKFESKMEKEEETTATGHGAGSPRPGTDELTPTVIDEEEAPHTRLFVWNSRVYASLLNVAHDHFVTR